MIASGGCLREGARSRMRHPRLHEAERINRLLAKQASLEWALKENRKAEERGETGPWAVPNLTVEEAEFVIARTKIREARAHCARFLDEREARERGEERELEVVDQTGKARPVGRAVLRGKRGWCRRCGQRIEGIANARMRYYHPDCAPGKRTAGQPRRCPQCGKALPEASSPARR